MGVLSVGSPWQLVVHGSGQVSPLLPMIRGRARLTGRKKDWAGLGSWILGWNSPSGKSFLLHQNANVNSINSDL